MGKKTEYKRQFREPSRMMQAEYRNNVQYCMLRRQQEHQHFFLEWDWESESENGPGLRTPVKNVNNSNSRYDRPDRCVREEGIMESGLLEKEVPTPDWHREKRPDKDLQQSDHRLSSVSNPPIPPARRPSEKKRSSSAHKRKSRPSTSPAPESGGKKPKPPFLAFGWADASKGVGNKLTYNIRATNEVHPAAIRAFKRRELDIERAEERQKRETLKKKRMKALFNNPTFQVDDDIWLTEYQRNFSGRTPYR